MKTNINFIIEENLYTPGQFEHNGVPCIKYADFIMFENGEYCHIMLIKSGELFMFKEYKTMNDIPFTIAKKVLKLAQMVDYSSYAIWKKPDTNCFEKLYYFIATI